MRSRRRPCLSSHAAKLSASLAAPSRLASRPRSYCSMPTTTATAFSGAMCSIIFLARLLFDELDDPFPQRLALPIGAVRDWEWLAAFDLEVFYLARMVAEKFCGHIAQQILPVENIQPARERCGQRVLALGVAAQAF